MKRIRVFLVLKKGFEKVHGVLRQCIAVNVYFFTRRISKSFSISKPKNSDESFKVEVFIRCFNTYFYFTLKGVVKRQSMRLPTHLSNLKNVTSIRRWNRNGQGKYILSDEFYFLFSLLTSWHPNEIIVCNKKKSEMVIYLQPQRLIQSKGQTLSQMCLRE